MTQTLQQDKDKDNFGGSLPTEVLMKLPGFFFSVEYLRGLAACSRSLLQAAADERHWADKSICAVGDEFQNAIALRQAERLWRLAEHAILNVPQLACVRRLPQRAKGYCFNGLAGQSLLPDMQRIRYMCGTRKFCWEQHASFWLLRLSQKVCILVCRSQAQIGKSFAS